MRHLIAIFGVVIAALVSSAFAQVGTAVETGHAKTRLVSETMAAAPGEAVTLAILQELDDKWHVYWKNPGDSGLPLDLEWSVPEGFIPGEVAYPLPHKLPLGPLVNFGHEGSPVFLIELQVPEDAAPGTTVPISVEARWLICYDICIPEEATLNLLLPIEAAAGAPTIGYADRIAAAKAEQPAAAPFEAFYHDNEGAPVLRLAGVPEGDLQFYPYTPSLLEPSGDVMERTLDGERWLQFVPGFAYGAASPDAISGVLVIETPASRIGYEIRATKTEAPAAATAPSLTQAVAAPSAPSGLLITLALSLLGGLILNVMPCVFPIVFLKAAGIAKLPRDERGKVRQYGLLYTLGVLTAFLGLAVALILLRAGGEQLGWGFHLQSPTAVGVFAVILFLIGLNLAGVFEIGQSVQGVGDGLTTRGGATGAFFTGLLAVAVAAPCIGPFLGGAVGVALTADTWRGVLIFLFIGLGLALPYLLISLVPGIARLLPRPGPWMSIAKQLFAFAMFATVVWLAWVVSIQSGSAGVAALGVSFVGIAFAAWLFGIAQRGQGRTVWKAIALAAAVVAVIPVVTLRPQSSIATDAVAEDKLPPVTYSAVELEGLRASNQAVFVDFTAAWCVSCQFNKRTVLDAAPVVEKFREKSVIYMVADWTLRDPAITEALESYGRAGVPLYLYFAPGAEEPEILPAILTRDVVLTAIDKGN